MPITPLRRSANVDGSGAAVKLTLSIASVNLDRELPAFSAMRSSEMV
jgi:hypothetical protein